MKIQLLRIKTKPESYITGTIVIFIILALIITIVVNIPPSFREFFLLFLVIYIECHLLISMSIKVNKKMIKPKEKLNLDIDFDNKNTQIKTEIIERFDYFKKENFEIPRLNEMLYQSRKTQIFGKSNIVNRIIIIFIIFGLQLYSILIPLLEGSISNLEFFVYLFFKIIFCEKVLAFNLIDIILNRKKVMKLMKKKNIQIIFWITITFYVFLFVSFIILFGMTKQSFYPAVIESAYYENNETWYKFDENFTNNPEQFCFAKSRNDGTFQTEDFAMMITLPRLYGINKEGKCYIKPSKRGLFNSTMKYIFGKEFEKDNIRIYCKKLFHDPILIITSDKILNSTLKHFSSTNITMMNEQFNITNKNYFDENRINKIKNTEVRTLYDIYETCISKNDGDKCYSEWEDFNQLYWIKEYSDKYEEIPGFERYQIQLEENMVIQPSFITNKGKYVAGTHYIVGGSYENRFGMGLFIETIGRKYVQLMLENLLPFYSMIRQYCKELFIRIERFNRHIFYFDFQSTRIISSLEHLLTQFNFTQNSLFFVGHSISGAAFKELSFISDIQGVTFETSDIENNYLIHDKRISNKKGKSESQIIDIYSDEIFYINKHKNSWNNKILPDDFRIPNVYETACTMTLACSENKKYVSHCEHVLAQSNNFPSEFFL